VQYFKYYDIASKTLYIYENGDWTVLSSNDGDFKALKETSFIVDVY
jgi:hypothetical protein